MSVFRMISSKTFKLCLFMNQLGLLYQKSRIWGVIPPHTPLKVNFRCTLNSFYVVYVYIPLHISYIMYIGLLCSLGSFYSSRCPYIFFKDLNVSYPSSWPPHGVFSALLFHLCPSSPFLMHYSPFPLYITHVLAYSFPGDTSLILRRLSSCLTRNDYL